MNTAEHYDLLIEEGNDPFRDPPALQRYMEQWDGPLFMERMQLHAEQEVLEIGVGTGRIARKAAPCCLHLTGIDLSEKTIARAAENLSVYPNITLICGDFSTYVFSRTFDVVYSSLTLMHFKDKRAFFAKVNFLLNPGGLFCLSIDRNQSRYIDMGSRRLRVYPDALKPTLNAIEKSGMRISEHHETAMAHIIVCTKPSPLQ